MIIGVPLEIMPNEGRVAATPETVRELREMGHSVMVEPGAGAVSGFQDEEYLEAGAQLQAALDIWRQADIVIKVKEPLFVPAIGGYECELQPEGSCLIAFLHPANHPDMVRMFERRRLTAISMDCIPRVDEARKMDALTSMSYIAGYKAVILAADHLNMMMHDAELPAGVLSGAHVLVVGFGVVGRQASETARGLGARVTVVDVREEALRRAEEMGARAVRILNGGTDEAAVRDTVGSVIADADVVILSALVFGERAPILVTEEMVRTMRPGSVIVDVSVDQGGNCDVVEPGQVTSVGGVQIVGILNLPGRLPAHSTRLYARNVLHFLRHLTEGGTLRLDDPIVRAATISRDGQILHSGALKALEAAGSSARS